ncbi:MAG: S66 peptidase family protein [Dissulfurimicrobium sp.]
MKPFKPQIKTTKPLKIVPFAPSSPPDPQKIKEGLEIIKSEGPETIWTGDPFMYATSKGNFDYLADRDLVQGDRFSRFLQDASVDFIWMIRGGYGSSRWIDNIRWIDTDTHQPMVIGFSDVTFLHAALCSRGFLSIHGPLITTLSKTNLASRTALWSCLERGEFPALSGKTLIKGIARGRLIGGNLTCLVHTLGTSYEPPWEGAILFIEDHNEAPYRLDRMITHLIASGRLSKVAGIAVGDLSPNQSSRFTPEELLKDRLSHLHIPVIMDIHAGHGEDNFPLLLGGVYELNGDTAMLSPI